MVLQGTAQLSGGVCMLEGGGAYLLWWVRKAGQWLELLALERARALRSGYSSRG